MYILKPILTADTTHKGTHRKKCPKDIHRVVYRASLLGGGGGVGKDWTIGDLQSFLLV